MQPSNNNHAIDATHERFVQEVRTIAVANLDGQERAVVMACKLLYGTGHAALRGQTIYSTWNNGGVDAVPIAEICAFGESSWIQVAGTTIHELGHVLAGHGAGHGKNWRTACGRLGLRFVRAAGTNYSMACFAPSTRLALEALDKPADGRPDVSLAKGMGGRPLARSPRGCPMGQGTRGGKSRGAGSGSRLRRYVCECQPKPVIIRCASDDLRAACLDCEKVFKQCAK